MKLGKWALAEMELKPFRNKEGEYLQLAFSRVDDRVRAPIWDPSEAILEELEVGEVYEVEGTEEEWNGQKQFKIHSLDPVPEEEVNPDDFIKRTKFPVEDVFPLMLEPLDPDVVEFLENLTEEFCTAPGAIYHHHACLGGLGEHTWEVCKLVAALHDQFDFDFYTAYLGAVLHDIGKIWTYSYKSALGMTDKGRLLGHVALGLEKLKPLDLPLDVMHIVASHHGKLEYGALMEPETPEAWAVHYADLASSQLNKVMKCG